MFTFAVNVVQILLNSAVFIMFYTVGGIAEIPITSIKYIVSGCMLLCFTNMSYFRICGIYSLLKPTLSDSVWATILLWWGVIASGICVFTDILSSQQPRETVFLAGMSMFLIGLGVIDAVILIYKRLSKEYPQSWMKYDFGDLEFGYRNFSKRESFVFPLFLYNGLFAILFVIIIISSLGPIYTWTNNTSLYTSSSNIRQIGVMDGYIKLGGVGHYQTVVSPGTYKILMVKETKSDEKYFITTYTESGEITVTWEWSTLNAGWMPVNYSIDGYTWYNYNDPICISWTLYQRKKYTDINEFEALLKVGKIDVGQ